MLLRYLFFICTKLTISFLFILSQIKTAFTLSTEESVKDLILHLKMDKVINAGGFSAWFTLTDNKDFEGAYHHFLDMIDGEIDLDDEDLMNIKLELVINSGDLIEKLVKNPSLDLEEYFESINIDVDLNDLDSYTASGIYNAVYEAQELRCEQAMIQQFGLLKAAYRGYIDKALVFVDQNGDPTTGAYAGVSMAAIVVVALASVGARKIGHRDSGSADKKAPLISESNNSYQKQIEKMEPESQDEIELCWQPVRVIRNITFHHGSAV